MGMREIVISVPDGVGKTLKPEKVNSEIVGELVRCKDCKHRDPEDHKCDSGHGILWNLPRQDDWFCADGEIENES